VLPKYMQFHRVNDTAAPGDGCLLLVRLRDGTFRFGMVLKGRFANYEYHEAEYVTYAHPERITHFMVIDPPEDFSPAEAEAETPQAEPPSIEAAALAAAGADVGGDVYL
jgi:hypothetical protein